MARQEGEAYFLVFLRSISQSLRLRARKGSIFALFSRVEASKISLSWTWRLVSSLWEGVEGSPGRNTSRCRWEASLFHSFLFRSSECSEWCGWESKVTSGWRIPLGKNAIEKNAMQSQGTRNWMNAHASYSILLPDANWSEHANSAYLSSSTIYLLSFPLTPAMIDAPIGFVWIVRFVRYDSWS